MYDAENVEFKLPRLRRNLKIKGSREARRLEIWRKIEKSLKICPGVTGGMVTLGIDLFGDILLYCKWLNTRNSLIFSWSVYQVKIVVKPEENHLLCQNISKTEFPTLKLNFSRLFQRIDRLIKRIRSYFGHPKWNCKSLLIEILPR